jgi:hypothetical protein
MSAEGVPLSPRDPSPKVKTSPPDAAGMYSGERKSLV